MSGVGAGPSAEGGRAFLHNDFSGTADGVFQAHYIGQAILNLPAVPTWQPRIPHQVPPPDPHFQDRQPEMARLVQPGAALSGTGGAVRIAVLSGMEGTGKTALARQLASGTAGRFSGGELFVDFPALPAGQASTTDAVAACLQGLGMERRFIPESHAERISMFRTLTAGQRLLLVLDGVTEPAQVRALQPTGPGSAVVVTTAYRMGELVEVDGAELLMLEPLDSGHARELLRSICGAARIDAEVDAAEHLIRICDGLPLALRVAAARLVQAPMMTVGDLVGEVVEGLDALSTEDGRGVLAVLTAAYHALPTPARRAYRLLGAAGEVTFTAEAVAALIGAPVATGRVALRALSAANLVVDLPRRRFRLLDLVRRHAAERAADEPAHTVREALDRRLRSCLATAAYADLALLNRHRLRLYDLAAATTGHVDLFDGEADVAEQWVADEWRNLLIIVRAAARRSDHDLVWRFVEVVAALSLNRRRPADLVELCGIGTEAASAVGRRDVRARLLSLASRGHLDLRQMPEAAAALDAAMRDAEAVGRLDLLASVREFEGRYLEFVDRSRAADAYRHSVQLNEDADEHRGAAIATFFLAGVLAAQGEEAAAVDRYMWALERLRELKDERMAARVQIGLGRLYLQLGELDPAARLLIEAVEVFAKRKASHYEAEALDVLAEVALAGGDIDGGREALTRLVKILDASGSERADKARQRLAALS